MPTNFAVTNWAIGKPLVSKAHFLQCRIEILTNFQKELSPKPDKKYSNIIHILKGHSFIYQNMFIVKPEVNYVKGYMHSKKPYFLTQGCSQKPK